MICDKQPSLLLYMIKRYWTFSKHFHKNFIIVEYVSALTGWILEGLILRIFRSLRFNIFIFQNGLYQSENQEERQSSFELDIVAQSQNPLLKNLTDFLIEEASAEEEELLGISSGEY